jgi:hypothetical protein
LRRVAAHPDLRVAHNSARQIRCFHHHNLTSSPTTRLPSPHIIPRTQVCWSPELAEPRQYFNSSNMLPSSPSSLSAQTLPRNFTFHYQDGQPPRTPEPGERQKQAPPSPPLPAARHHRATFRKQQRRPQIPDFQGPSFHAIYPSDVFGSSNDSRDVPLPSIEIMDAPTGFHHTRLSTNSDNGLQAIAALNSRPMSPPKTPVAQLYGANEVGQQAETECTAEDSSSQGEPLTRPSTACSGLSDTSKSSSVESFPSYAGSGASPESDLFGPPTLKPNPVSSPLDSYSHSTTEATPLQQKVQFTEAMDNHLWLQYMRYIQDPTHTPFKMLPGTAPPSGVCSRVAREAKRTWKGSRTFEVPRAYQFARWGSTRAYSPELVKSVGERTLSPTPNASWTPSEAATRRRLRDLCRRKPTLSAHYSRLLHARSPPPCHSAVGSRSSSLARQVSPPLPGASDVNSFSTRDMNISLATSTSSTMHFGNPLIQLTSDVSTPRPRATTQFQLPNIRSSGHQKSQSLHFGVGLGGQSGSSSGLASPFRPNALFPSCRTQSDNSIPSAASSGAVPSLAPPVELHAPIPRRSLFKRPAQQDLEAVMNSEDPFTRQNHLMRELFGPPAAAEPAHRRVRSRGFSLGDMSASTRLSNLFTPPDASEPMGGVTQTDTPNISTFLQPPSVGGPLRLGSPFAEKQHFNTFPRNFSLQGLEPAMEMNEERFSTQESTTSNGQHHL